MACVQRETQTERNLALPAIRGFLHHVATKREHTMSGRSPRQTPVIVHEARAAQCSNYQEQISRLRHQREALSAQRSNIDTQYTRDLQHIEELESRLQVLRSRLTGQLQQGPQVHTNVLPEEAAPYAEVAARAKHWQWVAEQLTEQLQRLNELVRIDGLTGLQNRRSFDEHLAREVARADRADGSLCLLMIDIDHFKKINDGSGHQVGDEVLRHVASNIAACIRPSDHAARFGGEEFAVVLAGVEKAHALAVAERIRAKVEHDLAMPCSATVSVGLATYEPLINYAELCTPSSLLRAADQALYTAKHRGRNRVQLASYMPPSIRQTPSFLTKQ